AGAVADPRLDPGAFLPGQYAAAGAVRQMPGQIRSECARPERQLPVRPVPHAFARRQDPQGQGRSAVRQLTAILKAPALRALLAQVLAFPFTLAAVWLLARAGLFPAPGPSAWTAAAALQGAW